MSAPRSSERGQVHRHHGTPALGIRRPDRAAVGLDDRASDRQTEAGSVSGPRGVGAVEALENPFLAARWQARSGVAYLEPHATILLSHRDRNRRLAVTEGVVEEKQNQEAERVGTAAQEPQPGSVH